MMRSLFSGVTGLKVHQTKMDVIGNNIANVNTVGFKASSVNFSDVLYQTTSNATGPNANTGQAGQNAKQIGLGASVASITTNIDTTGGSQRTDNPFDVMINGDYFFIVNSAGTNYFTKSGAFNIDANGTLCTSSGATVMGWQVNENGTDIVRDEVSALRVMSEENMYAAPEATTDAVVTGNIDEYDTQLTADGAKVQVSFFDNVGNTYSLKLSVKANADSKTIGTYTVIPTDVEDENGNSLFVTKTTAPDGTVTYGSTGYKIRFAGEEYSANVNATTGEVTLSTGTAANDGTELQYNIGNGKFVAVGATTANGDATNKVTFSISDVNGGFTTVAQGTDADESVLPFRDIDIDFSKTTKYKGSSKCNLEAKKGDLDGLGAGKKVGEMTGISIDSAGKIFGAYDNGTEKLLGQIAVASFANPSGLEAVGNSMFKTTQNSGEFDGIGKDASEDGKGLTPGVLEMSNVDLSSEFTQMITTQRGFQANSRIITTSDTMLEELINLKR